MPKAPHDSILVVGAGYVGLATAVFLAQQNCQVHVVDKNTQVVKTVASGRLTFAEPLLERRLNEVIRSGKLTVSLSKKDWFAQAAFIVIAIDSVDHSNWKMRLKSFREMAAWIGERKRPSTVILKSTNILGFAEYFRKTLDRSSYGRNIRLVVSPEFLREGKAYQDTIRPSRLIIGAQRRQESQAVRALYGRVYSSAIPIIETTYRGAELIKLASNLYLSHRLAFIHEVADYASQYHLDLDALRQGIGLDPRIGLGYFNPGIGFGGSCLPKDLNLINSRQMGSRFTFLSAQTAEEINNRVLDHIVKRLKQSLGTLNRKSIALLGCTFKEDNDDVRGSRALLLAQRLRRHGANVRVHEPHAPEGSVIHKLDHESVNHDISAALKGVSAIVIGASHRQFSRLSCAQAKKLVAKRFVCDPFRMLPRESWESHGFIFV